MLTTQEGTEVDRSNFGKASARFSRWYPLRHWHPPRYQDIKQGNSFVPLCAMIRILAVDLPCHMRYDDFAESEEQDMLIASFVGYHPQMYIAFWPFFCHVFLRATP